jgi:hypothetical protein
MSVQGLLLVRKRGRGQTKKGLGETLKNQVTERDQR